jgi:iron complex transport system ATP-binding protein
MIEIDDVTVRYGDVVAVSAATERVDSGAWVGLIGPNGAGKTTLLRAVAGLVPHEGAVVLGGLETSSVSRRRLARTVAFVPQHPTLPADMEVADYVLLGRTPHVGYFGGESAKDRRVCGELIERLDLAGASARRLLTLSGGELQRLVLARALAQEAPVLLLDEPTSALDLGRRIEALELVDELRAERGLTVVSAMHDLTLAGQFAERLLLMTEGRIVAAGSPHEVLRAPVLERHFGADVHVLATPDGQVAVVPSRRRKLAEPATAP